MTVVTLAIVVLCAAAFAWTQMLKQEEVPVTGIDIDRGVAPGCDCPREEARLSFVLQRAQPVTATVVDDSEAPVRTLLAGALRGSGRQTLTWNGAGDDGRVVPDGDYRLRLDLAEPDRVILLPDRITVEASGPAPARDAAPG